MTIVDAPRPVTGGVDTHLDLDVAAALDPVGGLLEVAEFPATSGGHRRLLGWLAGFGPVTRVVREASLPDERNGGFLNATLEEYPIAVNADIGELDVSFIDEPDPMLNPVGVKGLGEVSMVGVAPAIVNAVFHATGRRHRKLPIRIEDVLAAT
jgi:hypothetical protein